MPAAMNDILYDEFWAGLKTRLDSVRMQSILKGSGRIYVLGLDALPESEGPQNADWGRLVILPTLTLWPQVEVSYEPTNLAFLVRAEVNDFVAPGYQPARALGLAQSEAYQQLDAWLPTGYTRLLFALPLRRVSAPQPVPLPDRPRGVLLTSSQYRGDVAGIAAA